MRQLKIECDWDVAHARVKCMIDPKSRGVEEGMAVVLAVRRTSVIV